VLISDLLPCWLRSKVAGPACKWTYISVASWAVFPHNWAGFYVPLRDFFCCCGLRFFGLVLSKCLRFFGLVFRKIFLSKSIVFINSAEIVRFVFTWSNVIAGFLVRFCSLDVRSNISSFEITWSCVWSHGQQCWLLISSRLKFVGKDMVLLWSHHAVHYCC